MRKLSVVLVLAFLTFLPNASSALTYEVVDLGNFDMGFAKAVAINNNGQILVEASSLGYLLDGNNVVQIGSVGLYDINDKGQVVGGIGDDAFVYEDGNLNRLFQRASTMYRINNHGVGVGSASSSAFIWDGQDVTFIPKRGNNNEMWAHGINDRGQIVGAHRNSIIYASSAFLLDGDDFIDLGKLAPGRSTSARDINESGQIVGCSWNNNTGFAHAFIWEDGVMQDLGTLDSFDMSQAWAINEHGQVVGWAIKDPVVREYHGFIYDGGMMLDLNDLIPDDSEWTISQAFDINDHGQIVGWGKINGERHAVLLNPVPEPSTLFLLGAGILGLVGYRRKRSK